MKLFIRITKLQINTFIFISLLFAAGCNNKSSFDKDAAQKAIEAADSVFVNLLDKGDATGLANCYTSDALLMAPNAPSIQGRTNIQSAMMEFIESGATKMTVRINNVWGDEETLISEGTMTFAPKDGQVAYRSKYITVYKKEDGRWKMFRDCYNSDLPLSAAK